MAKKKKVKIVRAKIFTSIYSGFLDEITEEAKEMLSTEKPELYIKLFGIKPEIIN